MDGGMDDDAHGLHHWSCSISTNTSTDSRGHYSDMYLYLSDISLNLDVSAEGRCGNCSQLTGSSATYPRLGPLGTKNGATTPTRPHSVVKQIMGRAKEWYTMASERWEP